MGSLSMGVSVGGLSLPGVSVYGALSREPPHGGRVCSTHPTGMHSC